MGHSYGAIVELGPIVGSINANCKIATSDINLPVRATSWASTQFDVITFSYCGKRVELVNTIP